MMKSRSNTFTRIRLILVLVCLLITSAYGQTRSRLRGQVVDAESNEPLIGVNIIIDGTGLGAASDINGEFIIINIPIGKYEVTASMIGYNTQRVTDIRVSAGQVADVEFRLSSSVIAGSMVEVVAQRPKIQKEVSSTQLVVSDAQLQDASGVREINAFLSKLPGVSEDGGHLSIRGGSADQTGLMLNGLSYYNPATGNAESSVPLSAIEQVSLMSGGYNAEFGNFRSGLINVTTKSGSKNGYEGTIQISQNNSHLKRFGRSFYDPMSAGLRPYLDPQVAFVGTQEGWEDDEYLQGQFPRFAGWNRAARNYNIGKDSSDFATPMDYYLLAAWMHMAVPEYERLANLSDSMKTVIGYFEPSDEQKKIIADHANTDISQDYNLDAGFGGPVPLIGKALGEATFYISHKSQAVRYVIPMTRASEETHTTLATLKSQPRSDLTLTLNFLNKLQKGMSPMRPAWGDFPDASREGGFMPENNVKYFHKNPEYWYDVPFWPVLEQKTMMGGININHILNEKTYWELSLSTMRISDDSPVGNTRDSTVLTRFGPFPVTEMPYGKLQYGENEVTGIFGEDTLIYEYPSYDALPGVNRRFRRKEGDLYTNVKISQHRAKFDLNAQRGQHHFWKTGFEYNYIDLDHNLWHKWNENYYNVYEFNYHRTPSQTGLYLQDQITYDDIIANLGLRFDYYYGGGGEWPVGDPFAVDAFTPQSFAEDSVLFEYLEAGDSYIWDLWEAYDDSVDSDFLQPIKNHYALSPRIGISFPVTEKSKFYFNYGHFRSNPPYYTMYLYRYRYTKNGLYDMSNPNLEPPRTISYELGLNSNVFSSYIVKISAYSKDVTGQHGEVNYQSVTGGLDYDMWANNEYEDIQGFELNISKADRSWLTGWINFNYMLTRSGLVGKETITNAAFENEQEGLYEGQESRTLPIPKVNANITLRTPGFPKGGFLKKHLMSNWSFTVYAEWKAGNYFTWNPTNELHVSDNLQWPDYKMVDLKINKRFDLMGYEAGFFADISNIFNIKVSQIHRGYAFTRDPGAGGYENWRDFFNYMGSLRLKLYDSPEYDALRENYEGYFLSGDDEVGDLRSAEKPYINDPDLPLWLYGEPRDIWVGFKLNF